MRCWADGLFGAQGLGRVDGGGATSGDEAGYQRGGGKSDDGSGKDGDVGVGDVVELRFDQADADKGDGDADGEAKEGLKQSAAHDHGDDARALRAVSHADADLGGAADYCVGGDSIEAEGGEQEGEGSEEEGEAGDHALVAEAVSDLGLKGLKLDY